MSRFSHYLISFTESMSLNFSPGRFFAMHEIKAILAYILIEYDISVPGSVRPQDKYYGYTCIPNTTANVSFKRRSA